MSRADYMAGFAAEAERIRLRDAGVNINRVRQVATDAAEAAVRRMDTDAARAERLRTRLGSLIGTIPDEHVTSREVGKYGLEKFRQELPDNGDHATALEYYLAGRMGARNASGMDSASREPTFLDKYLNAE
jgi:hypothetical protein